MDDKKNIENKIKESFEGLNKSAPSNLWNKLSDKLPVDGIDKNIDAKIKEGFENMNTSAPAQIWSTVNKQLNIDKVWKRINKELDERPVIIYWRRMVGVVALLLLLLSGSVYVIKNKYSSSPITQYVQITQKSKQINKLEPGDLTKIFISDGIISKEKTSKNITKTVTHTQNSNAEINNSNNSEKSTIQQNYSTQKSNVNKSILNSNTSNISIEKNTDTILQTLSPAEADSLSFIAMIPIKINLIENTFTPELILPNLSIFDSALTATRLKKKRFEIGITYSHNNTWIINNNTRSSFDENSLIQTTPAYAGSYGLVANYNIFKKSSVSAEFYINSKYIQRYDVFNEGTFNNKSIEFNYYKLTLLYQFNVIQPPYKVIPSKYTFKGGIYGSSLKNQKHDYNRITLPETDTYATVDYGIKIAIGQEKTFQKIIIGYGINAEYGFKNIFDGNPQMSAGFNATKNALLGAYLNVKYGF